MRPSGTLSFLPTTIDPRGETELARVVNVHNWVRFSSEEKRTLGVFIEYLPV